MTTAREIYTKAALALHGIERKIANLTRWSRPEPDSVSGRVLAALEARRDHDTAALIPLKIAVDAEAPVAAARYGGHIAFKSFAWVPLGTATVPDCDDIPTFLRQVRP